MAKSFLLLLLLVILSCVQLSAQRWKKVRQEWIAGIGTTNFIGELGGADAIGTNYFSDLDFAATRPALSVGYRYKIKPWLSWKSSLTYGTIYGHDKFTKEFNRKYRNLHFWSPVVELCIQIEPSLIAEKVGSYRLTSVRGKKNVYFSIYPFLGVSFFWFDPRASFQGQSYRLQPLRTEGQGLVPTREPYSLFQFAIPFGFGIKYGFRRYWYINLEYGLRKTFTDYLDDVSMTYFDPAQLAAKTGSVTPYLADQSDNSIPDKTKPGAQRGDPSDNDSYMFMIISVSHQFKAKKKRRQRAKF